jgi:hypothetical protein
LLKSIAKTQSETEQLVCLLVFARSFVLTPDLCSQKAQYDKLEQEYNTVASQALHTLDNFKTKKEEYRAILDDYAEFQKKHGKQKNDLEIVHLQLSEQDKWGKGLDVSFCAFYSLCVTLHLYTDSGHSSKRTV